MRLRNTLHFFIFAIIFLAACTNFNQDRMADSSFDSEQKKKMLSSAYLDSATSQLFAHHQQQYDTSYRNPYGFQERDIVLYPDSIYERRITSLHSLLPLVFNEQVKAYIELYAFRKRDLTERMLGKSALYYPHIEKLLRKHQLPLDLKLLTMIESALRPTAESSKSAAGLWQIRYNTGKWLGLTINDFIDERRDPYTSSIAGIAYLKKLYTLYGDWWLAIAAYNYGPNNLNKAIVRAGNVKDYWKVTPYLPRETRHYVPAFIAMVYLYHFQDEHNLRPQFPDVSFKSVDTVRIYDKIAFDEIVQYTGVSKKELAMLNPAIMQEIIPASQEGYRLVLPVSKIATFEKIRTDLFQANRWKEEVAMTARVIKGKKAIVPKAKHLIRITHTIQPGNTLDEISRHYGCTVQDLIDWNGLYDSMLQIGNELKVYIPQEQAFHLQASTISTDFSSNFLRSPAHSE